MLNKHLLFLFSLLYIILKHVVIIPSAPTITYKNDVINDTALKALILVLPIIILSKNPNIISNKNEKNIGYANFINSIVLFI